MATIAIGTALAKLVLSASELDPSGQVRQRRDLRRDSFAAWLFRPSPQTVAAAEASRGMHHGARYCGYPWPLG